VSRRRVQQSIAPGNSPLKADTTTNHATHGPTRLPSGTQHVLAFLRRRGGYRRFVVQSFPQSSGFYLALALARRGERVTDLEADLNGDSTLVLRSDGIHVLFAHEAGSTCVYQRGRFRCVLSSD
jgi:hypothetical protein